MSSAMGNSLEEKRIEKGCVEFRGKGGLEVGGPEILVGAVKVIVEDKAVKPSGFSDFLPRVGEADPDDLIGIRAAPAQAPLELFHARGKNEHEMR